MRSGKPSPISEFATSPATRIDLTFDWCKVVLRRGARNARRRCTPILSATFDIYRFEERGREEDCYGDYNRDAIDFDISSILDRKSLSSYILSIQSETGISYSKEESRMDREKCRARWKLNTAVDIRGSSSLFLDFVKNRSDYCRNNGDPPERLSGTT